MQLRRNQHPRKWTGIDEKNDSMNDVAHCMNIENNERRINWNHCSNMCNDVKQRLFAFRDKSRTCAQFPRSHWFLRVYFLADDSLGVDLKLCKIRTLKKINALIEENWKKCSELLVYSIINAKQTQWTINVYNQGSNNRLKIIICDSLKN